MSSHAFYDKLKDTPLAKAEDEVSIEEIAIWLDMNSGSTMNVKKILQAIENNYHVYRIDSINDGGKVSLWMKYPLAVAWFSDRALFWIFKLMSETNVLDKQVLNNKFIEFAKKTRDKYKAKIKDETRQIREGLRLFPLNSRKYQSLYEVFAELVDILEMKIHIIN